MLRCHEASSCSCSFIVSLSIVLHVVMFSEYLRVNMVQNKYKGALLQSYHEKGRGRVANDTGADAFLPRLNLITLLLGSVACLGISTVASFQMDNVLRMHMLGSMLFFGGMLAYMPLQIIVTARTSRRCRWTLARYAVFGVYLLIVASISYVRRLMGPKFKEVAALGEILLVDLAMLFVFTITKEEGWSKLRLSVDCEED